jgi:hypothetical protein
MSAIEDIKKEIIQRRKVPVPNQEPAKPEKTDKKPKGEKKAMTKAEIEAYKQKMMEREEARYLGKESKDSREQVKKAKQVKPKESKPSQSDSKQDAKQKKEQKKAPDKAVPKRVKADMPRILQPLEPLYLLRIPGLPKGDCLAICYARGADA